MRQTLVFIGFFPLPEFSSQTDFAKKPGGYLSTIVHKSNSMKAGCERYGEASPANRWQSQKMIAAARQASAGLADGRNSRLG
jgi:hypothetical protein